MRTFLIAAAAALLIAPAAQASTTATFNNAAHPHVLAFVNDSDAETFKVEISYLSGSPAGYKFVITASNANITLPPGPNCAGGGTKVITCTPTMTDPALVDRVDIKGGPGNDTFNLDAGTSYDTSGNGGLSINGEDGEDTFNALANSALRTSVTGGPGNDTFNGADAASDTFQAEAGNDTYVGGTVPPHDPPDLGIPAERYQRETRPDTWSAVGSGPVNISLDGAANDTDGQGGTDNVKGDIEQVIGGGGNDTLAAGTAGVYLAGADGDDTLTGSGEGDDLFGGSGSDTISGAGGDDTLDDGDYDGAYRLTADMPPAPGNDKLNGGDGDDVLSAGDGTDDVVGGAGVDTVYYGRVQTQVFDATPDFNTFQEKYRPMTVTLDDAPNDGPTGASEGDNLHADVENVDTSATGPANSMWTARSTRVDLGGGTTFADDNVTGSPAANVITTGAGNDTIDGGPGPDTINAGTGNDKVTATDKATDLIDCGKDTDAAAVDLPGTNPGRADSVTGCETVTGTALGLEGGALPVPAKVALGGASSYKVKKFVRTYTVTSTVTTDQTATVGGELTIGGAKIATTGDLVLGTGRLKAGTGARKLKVRIAVRFRKALKHKLRTKKQRRRGIKLGLVVTVTNASGQATVSRKTIRVRG